MSASSSSIENDLTTIFSDAKISSEDVDSSSHPSPEILKRLQDVSQILDPSSLPSIRLTGEIQTPFNTDDPLEWFWLPSIAHGIHPSENVMISQHMIPFPVRRIDPLTNPDEYVILKDGSHGAWFHCRGLCDIECADKLCKGGKRGQPPSRRIKCRVVPCLDGIGYNDVKFIAAGAFGAVATAIKSSTNESVALKIIPKQFCRSYNPDNLDWNGWRAVKLTRREIWCFLMLSIPEASKYVVQLRTIHEDMRR